MSVATTEQQTPKTQPTSITDLQPKMQLEGVVKKIELYGAFIDLGLERDGLIHISQLGDRRVSKVSDVVQEGDQVTVWVTSVDPAQGRIGLSMMKPPAVEWKVLAEGQTYTGCVVRIEQYGVFVDFGAERPGLLHVRDMGHHFVRHPSELFHDGDEVDVRILQLDRRKKRIDLTIVDLRESVFDDEDESTPTHTYMEIAFREAQEEARRRTKRSGSTHKSSKRRIEQEAILARTLKKHSQ